MREYITLVVTEFQQNARIVFSEADKSAVVIDPGGDVPRILREIKSRNLNVEQIWLTHSHIDHCGGVNKLKLETGAKLFGHQEESFMREGLLSIADMYGLSRQDYENCPEPDVYISGGETLSFAGADFQVLYTPGHSPGHLCFYSVEDNTLIAGDTLFFQSIGRTDLPGGDHSTLINSIKEKIFSLPNETKVLSGHGPDTTVGFEKDNNPFLS
ncbi:MAG: MBL fold metallo-hydrolase [Bdellovibrionales bacterium]|nr:MBL fold metallo-hydrolase [Bdellovibrionales bacterium]